LTLSHASGGGTVVAIKIKREFVADTAQDGIPPPAAGATIAEENISAAK